MRVLTLGLSAVAFIVLITFLVRFRVKPIKIASVAAEDWERTEEVTEEAATGRTLRIWIDPSDGSRHAVAELR
ncbi:MAG: hypothetical protein JWN96_4256 [Mycobacterium sp.]|jgi:hypothetical protein|nr:hypothetical protein [Mycobacterium sp.]